jgi:hypothetical protein
VVLGYLSVLDLSRKEPAQSSEALLPDLCSVSEDLRPAGWLHPAPDPAETEMAHPTKRTSVARTEQASERQRLWEPSLNLSLLLRHLTQMLWAAHRPHLSVLVAIQGSSQEQPLQPRKNYLGWLLQVLRQPEWSLMLLLLLLIFRHSERTSSSSCPTTCCLWLQ